MERRGKHLSFIYKFPLASIAPDLWGDKENIYVKCKGFPLAYIAPDLLRGQGMHCSISKIFLLASIAPDL